MQWARVHRHLSKSLVVSCIPVQPAVPTILDHDSVIGGDTQRSFYARILLRADRSISDHREQHLLPAFMLC